MDMNTGFFDWGLTLPSTGVARRIIANRDIAGRVVLAELEGPGCIRRFQVTGKNIGRELVLRLYFDGHTVPHVEAPLADFFGIMHNLSEFSASPRRREHPDRASYRLNTPFLISNPHNAFTACFPMPFARSARIEVEHDAAQPSHLFYYVDWHEYGAALDEPMRFCARWRREAPVRDYQDDFLVLDADGPGRLIGYVHSIAMLHSRQIMRWSHAGSDSIYLDGGGAHPAYIRGHGAEDTFGASYGGHTYPAQSSLFADMPYYEQLNDHDTDLQKLTGYRFFAHEAVCFADSIHLRFGARAHDLAATVYWYAAAPPRPFVAIPPYADRLPGRRPRRQYDRELPDSGQWWVCGPFPACPDLGEAAWTNDCTGPAAGAASATWPAADSGPTSETDADSESDAGSGPLPETNAKSESAAGSGATAWPDALSGPGAHPAPAADSASVSAFASASAAFDPAQPVHGRLWRHYAARRGFVDFNHVFRPAPSNANTAALHAAAVAVCAFEAPSAGSATLRFGWDDTLAFRLNDDDPRQLGDHAYFRSRQVPVQLRRGANQLMVRLTNTTGLNRGGWCFTCGIVTASGETLRPEARLGTPPWPDDYLLAIDFGAGEASARDGRMWFAPPYAADPDGVALSDRIELICSPQSQRFPSTVGPLEVTVSTGDDTSLGFRRATWRKSPGDSAQAADPPGSVRASARTGRQPVALELRVGGLPPGTYRLTTTHHEHETDPPAQPMRVWVNGEPATDEVVQGVGAVAGAHPVATHTFTVKARAQEAVCLRWEAPYGPLALNALDLNALDPNDWICQPGPESSGSCHP